MKKITLLTTKMWTDITSQCQEYVQGKADGYLHIMSQHTTAGVLIFEKELLLLADVDTFFTRIAPNNGSYNHDRIHLREVPPTERINGAAHLRSLFVPTSQLIPFRNGKLCLGQWQSILIVELDGERERTFLLSTFAMDKE